MPGRRGSRRKSGPRRGRRGSSRRSGGSLTTEGRSRTPRDRGLSMGPMSRMPFPTRAFTRLYSQIVGYFASGLTFQTCSVGGNRIVFPWSPSVQPGDYAGFGVSGTIYDSMDLTQTLPAQYPIYELMYGKWRVWGSRIKVTIVPSINNGSGQSPQAIQVVILPSNTFNLITGTTHLIASSPYSRSKLIAPGFGKSNSVSHRASSCQVMGVSKSQYCDQSFSGETSTCVSGRGNPVLTNSWFWVVNFAAADAASQGNTQFQVEVWWDVEFTDPRVNVPFDQALEESVVSSGSSFVDDEDLSNPFADMALSSSSQSSSSSFSEDQQPSSSRSVRFDHVPSVIGRPPPNRPDLAVKSRIVPIHPHEASLKSSSVLFRPRSAPSQPVVKLPVSLQQL